MDLYNKNREPLGQIHQREKPLAKDEWILCAGVWVVTPEQKILVTFRAPAKKFFPSYWENPGGGALAGESTRVAVARELKEETGIKANPEEFQLIATSYHWPLIFDSYGLFKDIRPDDITLDESETVAAKLITLEELEDMVRTGKFAPPIETELRNHRDSYYHYYHSLMNR